VYFALYDVGTSLGVLARFGPPTNGSHVYVRRKFSPSAAAHTYKVNVFTDSGTATINAGGSGSGALMPGYIRVTRA
jgi:hypothetical protein